MAIKEQLERNVQAIQDLIRGKLPFLYSNYCLEGSLDEPMALGAIASLYSYAPGSLEYCVISLSDIGLTIGEVRKKILNYQLRPEISESQQKLTAIWRGNIVREIFLQMKMGIARRFGVPLTFITFCLTDLDSQLSAHIWHPPDIPTEICLMLLREHVVAAIHRDN